MAAATNPTYSRSSCVYEALSSSTEVLPAGRTNPIDLPIVPISSIRHRLGTRLAQGDVGVIYEVKDCEPKRIFKLIPLGSFKRGHEIRVSQFAGDIGVGPKVHSAFLMKQSQQTFVIIEMDRIGRSLSQWMTTLAENRNPIQAAAIQIPTLEETEDKLLKNKNEEDAPYVVVSMPQQKISLAETVGILYGKQEPFYFELFSRIKSLAERNIAYLDTNPRNIIPNYELGRAMQLIDFDQAMVTERVSEAVLKVLRGMFTSMDFANYLALPDLSTKSRELIDWFHLQAKKEMEYLASTSGFNSK